jgi:DnaJ family protein C protein 2
MSLSPLFPLSDSCECPLDRKKVLKHHPDKKAAGTGAPAADRAATLLGISVSQNTNDDAFFKCIQKAHEVLTNAEKRRQFDSVDPAFLEEEEERTGITATEFKVAFDFFFIPGILQVE